MEAQVPIGQHNKVEAFGRKHHTSLVTLLFTDMAGSTALKQQLGDQAGADVFRKHHELIRETLRRFPQGEEIETAGDSFFLIFATPSDAVAFALLTQAGLRGLHEVSGAKALDRIGIHVGEVLVGRGAESRKPKDLFGIQIDTCARVMSLAKAGQVLMTRAVFDSARQVLKGEAIGSVAQLEWLNHGPYLLKGLDEPVEICEVRGSGQETGGPPTSSERAQRHTAALDEPVLGWRPALGQVVPRTRWTLEGKLGAGGFGEVWLGRHPTTKETRVFKFCFQAERVRFLKRELTLFRLLKERVGNHRNIVRMHDVCSDQPPFYVEMDYVEGKDLRSWCEAQGEINQVPLELRLEIVAQAADALQAAHDAGIIHRDIKPANILVATSAGAARTPRLEVKLTDFGIGQVMSEEYLKGITRAGFTQTMMADSSSSHTGTQLYMAPELLAGKAASARSDIYSLAAVLYQLLAGSFAHPVTSDWAACITDPVLREDLRVWLAGDPDHRPANASELAAKLRAWPERRKAFASAQRRLRARRLLKSAALAAVVLVLGATAGWLYLRNSHVRWARETAVPEVTRLADAEQFSAALALAQRAERFTPQDPVLSNLLDRISVSLSADTRPAGAVIEIKEYRNPNQPWRRLGVTPITGQRVPRGFYRWRVTKDGYESVERAWPARKERMEIKLDRLGSLPPGMISVPGGEFNPVLTGLADSAPVQLGDFVIDKFEVSNQQFKEFVDQGAYQRTNFWIQPFIREGQVVSREKAMSYFRDQTGRPGPSTWKDGSYPSGQAEYPVTGISWYEAAAYAEFAHKSLPTVFHWYRAAHSEDWGQLIQDSTVMVKLSNFDKHGPAPVGQYQGLSPWGAYDMAGNAREWCWNESPNGRRYMLGGSWDDPGYMFYDLDESDPFDRSLTRGFRCMKAVSGAEIPRPALTRVTRGYRDYRKERPVSEEVFRAYKRFFDYERTPLDAVVEPIPDGSELWRKEKVTFKAADSDEKVPAYLFLPRKAPAPYQTILFFPHGDARQPERSQKNLVAMDHVSAVLESGRAVFYPVYQGTYERYDASFLASAARIREYRIQLAKEFRRAIDYLETRPDIDHARLAYVGVSWGGSIGPALVALEDRVRTAIWVVGGLPQQPLPEVVDIINFAPRVTVPILMINGRYDPIFPLETSQLPLFNLLGTPRERKRHLIYDRGHEPPPPSELRKEFANWLDKYLGPVR